VPIVQTVKRTTQHHLHTTHTLANAFGHSVRYSIGRTLEGWGMPNGKMCALPSYVYHIYIFLVYKQCIYK
jgi:hypothetical protein